MRTTPMSFDFADSSNRQIYAHWHVPPLERLFGDTLDFHWDLYELTHLHRRGHNSGKDDGHCTAWPSPPYRAPVWQIIAERIGAKRFLEVGTGLGYTAALMADAGGPDSRVDTIEIDPVHADLAEAELSKRGVSDRVRILRGDATEILQTLDEPYDAVFSDGGQSDISHELRRLTRPGGAGAGIKSRLREPLIGALTDLRASLANKTEPELEALSRARRRLPKDSLGRVVMNCGLVCYPALPGRLCTIDDLLAIRDRERSGLLSRIVNDLKNDRRVCAAWLSGSVSRGDDDGLSDLDFMSLIVAKYIARRNGETVGRMTSVIARTLTEAANLLDSNLPLPRRDAAQRSAIGSASPTVQFEFLYGLALDATRLHQELEDQGAAIPSEAIPHIYRFFELTESMAAGQLGPPYR